MYFVLHVYFMYYPRVLLAVSCLLRRTRIRNRKRIKNLNPRTKVTSSQIFLQRKNREKKLIKKQTRSKIPQNLLSFLVIRSLTITKKRKLHLQKSRSLHMVSRMKIDLHHQVYRTNHHLLQLVGRLRD